MTKSDKLDDQKASPDASIPPLVSGDAPKKESAAFKQMKQGLTRPAGMGNMPGGFGAPKKSGPSLKGGKQVGRNQKFGGAGNRTGVPRRTAG